MVRSIFTRWEMRHAHGRGPSDRHAAWRAFGAAMTDTAQALHDVTPIPPESGQEVHLTASAHGMSFALRTDTMPMGAMGFAVDVWGEDAATAKEIWRRAERLAPDNK